MPVAGELGDFDLAGILGLLANRCAVGRLRLVTGGDDVALYLDGGRLVGVTSARLALRLGRVLIQRGLVSDKLVRAALQLQEREGGRRSLGEILVARGWVSEEQVAACIHEQCVAALVRILLVSDGMFCYAGGVLLPVRGPVRPLDPQAAVLEAMQRVDELGRLRARLPASDAPLVVTELAETSAAPVGDAERRIVGALKAGVWSWRELPDVVQIEEPLLLRTMLELLERGVVVSQSWSRDVVGALPPDEVDLERLVGAERGS